MTKRLVSVIMSLMLMFAVFIPPVNASTITMYATDGRTADVEESEVALWQEVGWFTTADDAKLITMYSSDGRTISIPQYYRQDYLNAWWFNTEDDAKIITMYSSDGRTISIPQYYRDDYLKVNWFNTAEDAKIISMYSMDGREISIVQCEKEAYSKVGWYADIADVTVTMYDDNGNEYTVFKDNIQREIENGLSLDNPKNLQLMFSANGKFTKVPPKDVEAYKKVGWYCAGSNKIDPNRPMVALTFDDGPGQYTNSILSVLEKYNARATFFVVGQNVASYQNVLVRALNIGCEIGNHTWSHRNLTSGVGTQISSTNQAVYNATGVYPKIYRPPYGSYNSSVLRSVSMPAIMWSVDTLDWKTRNASKTLQSVQRDTRDGSIILMHDIHLPTANAVEPVVKWLLMNDYQLVTVSELLNARYGGAANGKVYNSAP